LTNFFAEKQQACKLDFVNGKLFVLYQGTRKLVLNRLFRLLNIPITKVSKK